LQAVFPAGKNVIREVRMANRRTSIRVQTRIKAMLAAENLREPCAITDLSDAGARVSVKPALLLPDLVCLRAPEIGLCKSGRVVWRRGSEAGLLFTG
jgi:hypothetical protein